MFNRSEIKNIIKWNEIVDPVTNEPIMPYKINCNTEEIISIISLKERSDYQQQTIDYFIIHNKEDLNTQEA